jgi:hypothetical protein
MPSCPEFTPPLPPWTVKTAQAALGEAAVRLLVLAEVLERIHRELPPPPDLADRQEHRKPYDQTTDILATIECVVADDLRPAAKSLERSARITDAELEQEYLARERGDL